MRILFDKVNGVNPDILCLIARSGSDGTVAYTLLNPAEKLGALNGMMRRIWKKEDTKNAEANATGHCNARYLGSVNEQ